MKKAGRIILYAVVAVLLFITISFLILDKPLPKGEEGPAAEQLADAMLVALNIDAWDTTYAVRWSFYRGHNYLWDRKNDLVQVQWDDYEVIMKTTDRSGSAWKAGEELDEEATKEALNTAYEYFANDSFWLVAPYKIRDPGTKREVVNWEDNKALLVTYSSGGVTPGDSYLWLLDENNLPEKWLMWVNILPIGGVEFSWEDWKNFATGAKLALIHDGIFKMKMEDVDLGYNIEDLVGDNNPFVKYKAE